MLPERGLWNVAAERTRQEDLRAGLRLGEAVEEALSRTQAHPASPEAWYLLGRVRSDPGLQRVAFRRAMDLDPTFAWARYGMAHVERRLGRLEEAESLMRQTTGLDPEEPLFALVLAITLGANQSDRIGEALDVLASLGRDDEAAVDHRARLLAGPLADSGGALRVLDEGIAVRPESDRLWGSVRSVLERSQESSVLRTAERMLVRHGPEVSRQAWHCRALLAAARGRPARVLAALDRAGAGPTGEGLLRRPEVLADAGRLSEALDAWRASLPMPVRETARTSTFLSRVGGGDTQQRSLLLARSLADRLRAAYAGEDLTLEEFLVWGEQEADRWGWPSRGPTLIRRVPLAGEVTVSREGAPGLPGALAAAGWFGLFGRRVGEKVEGTLLRLVHRQPLVGEMLGRALAGEVVYVEDRLLEARAGHGGARIAGAAVHQGYFVDLDRVRTMAAAIEKLWADFPSAEARDHVLSGPLPARVAGGPAEPLQVAQKLLLRGAEHPGAAADRVLALVERHEQVHLADAGELLGGPIGWLDLLRLALEGGLRPSQMEMRLEYRAELGMVASSDDPHLALGQALAGFGPVGAHARAADRLGRRFADRARGLERLDPDVEALAQLHLLDAGEIREIALDLALEEGVARARP